MAVHDTPLGPIETRSWLHPDDANVTAPPAPTELLLMLHAAASAPGAFDELARTLCAPGRLIVAPALNGYGRSSVMAPGDAVDRHVALAEWVFRTFECQRNFVFGHSMGGLCALELSARVDCDRIAVFEPIVMGCLDTTDEAQRQGLQWDRDAVDALRAHVEAGQPEPGLAAFIRAWNEVEWDAVPAPVREALLASATRLSEETTVVSYRDAPESLGSLRIEVLLLFGSRSPVVAGQVVRQLQQRIRRASVQCIDNAGHMAPALAPQRLAAPLSDWFCL